MARRTSDSEKVTESLVAGKRKEKENMKLDDPSYASSETFSDDTWSTQTVNSEMQLIIDERKEGKRRDSVPSSH